MKIRTVTLTAVLFMSMAVTGYSQGFIGGSINRAAGGQVIGKSPIQIPIKDPTVRRDTYSAPTFPNSNSRPQGQPLGTVNRNMSSGGQTNINNFKNPNGTLFNPNTAQPRLFSGTQAGQTQPKLFSSTPAGQQNQPKLFSNTQAGQQQRQPTTLFGNTPAGRRP